MPKKVELSSPLSIFSLELPEPLLRWCESISTRVGSGPFKLQGYAKASLPSASAWGNSTEFSSLIYVNDDVDGPTIAFSDGTDWRRVQDRNVIS